jgi:hypothetical protein
MYAPSLSWMTILSGVSTKPLSCAEKYLFTASAISVANTASKSYPQHKSHMQITVSSEAEKPNSHPEPFGCPPHVCYDRLRLDRGDVQLNLWTHIWERLDRCGESQSVNERRATLLRRLADLHAPHII